MILELTLNRFITSNDTLKLDEESAIILITVSIEDRELDTETLDDS